MRRIRLRRARAAVALASGSTLLLAALPTPTRANSGVQLRLDNYQAGSEITTPGPIANAGFESATGNVPNNWTPDSPVMTSGAPDPSNLPNPPGVIGTRSALAAQTGGINPFVDYFFRQTVTLQPNTDYVLSSYIWNYASPGPAPHNDLFAGDLAVVQLRDSDPNNFLNTAGIILEPIGRDNQSGSRGYFVYKTFNSGQFSSTTVGLEVNFDPNQDVDFGNNRPALSAQWDNLALTPLTQFAAQRFTNPAGGAYATASNWVNGPANQVGAIATFDVDNAGAAPVTLSGAVSLAVINFNAAGGYALSGGSILLDHEERDDTVIFNNLKGSNSVASPIVVGVGTVNLGGVQLVPRKVRMNVQQAGDVLAVSGGISAASVGTLGTGTFDVTKVGAGRLDTRAFAARSLTVSAGSVRLLPNSTGADRVKVGTLTLSGGTTPTVRLDLTNSALVIDYTGDSPLATVFAQIQAGAAGGNGIGTSQGSGYAVGYAEASELPSVPAAFGAVDSTSLLVRGTRAGDANLDGIVNIADFSVLASNFNLPGNWAKGDSNHDGTVGIADFSLLASNFNLSAASVEASARGAAVPEPSLAALGVIGVALWGRGRR